MAAELGFGIGHDPLYRIGWRRRENREGRFNPLDLDNQVGAVMPRPTGQDRDSSLRDN